jgi:hypothetical protein
MITSMKAYLDAVLPTDRFALLWFLVAMLLAALTPIVTGLLFAFLIPVLFFFATIEKTPLTSLDQERPEPRFVVLSVFSPRPPPAL